MPSPQVQTSEMTTPCVGILDPHFGAISLRLSMLTANRGILGAGILSLNPYPFLINPLLFPSWLFHSLN